MKWRTELKNDALELKKQADALLELINSTEDQAMTYELVQRYYGIANEIEDLSVSVKSDISYLRDQL